MAVYVPNPDAGPVDDLVEQLAAEVASRYAAAETEMIRKVAEKVASALEFDPESLQAMQDRASALRDLRLEADRIMASVRESNIAAQVIHIAATEGGAAAVAQLGLVPGVAAGTSGLTVSSASALAQMTLDLTSRLDRMDARMTRWMPDVYQRAVAVATSNVLLGVDTARVAQKRATERLLAEGVDGFRDSKGRMWRPGTYAEMATRTSVNRAWQAANVGNLETAGVNLVTPVRGVDSCKTCSEWAGKVLSSDGTLPAGTHMLKSATGPQLVPVTVAGTVEQARTAGWNHPNCRCVLVGVFPGLALPQDGSTFDPQKERERDRMREIERNIRKWKRREAASLDDVGKLAAKRKVRKWQGAARAHVNQTSQLRKNYREQLHFSDGTPTPRRRTRPVAIDPAPAPVVSPGALARTQIAAAKTPADVQSALRTAYGSRGVRIEGLDVKGVNLARAQAWGSRMSDLLDTYPNTAVSLIVVAPIKNSRMYAHASAKIPFGQKKLYDITLTTSAGKMKTASKIDSSFANDVAKGFHFPIPDGVLPMEAVVTHEWGHLVDFTLRNHGVSLRAEVNEIRERMLREAGITNMVGKEQYDWTLKNISGYGRGNTDELIAEAFVDAHLNGAKATPFSQAIHARMKELLEGIST